MNKIVLITLAALLCTSCDFFATKMNTEQKIAEVNGKTLYLSDVQNMFPADVSAEDSLILLRSYVNNWARKQLVAKHAEQNLSKEQKDVSQELEDYRLSLLIYRYEKVYLEQRLDTIVTNEQIKKVYNESLQNYILSKPLVKVGVVKIQEDSLRNPRLRTLSRSKKPEDRETLIKLCDERNGTYTNFDGQWIHAETLAEKIPMDVKQIERDWSRGYLNTIVDGMEYIVTIYEFVKANEPAPLEYERNKIIDIIRHKRKQEVLKNLENSAYTDALNRNHLKTYIDN